MVITVDPPAPEPAPETVPGPSAPESMPAQKKPTEKAEKKPAEKPAEKGEESPAGGSVPEAGGGWATVHPLRRLAPVSTIDNGVTSSDEGEDGPMTATNTSTSSSSAMAGGETLDPGSAHHFCEQMRGLAERMFTELEQSVASLAAAGVSGAPITLLGQMQEHAALFRDSASSAQSHFARHLSTQDQVLADDSLAATVSGTYIGTRT